MLGEKSLRQIILELSYEVEPFDIGEYNNRIDGMIEDVRGKIEGLEEPEEIISEINKYLFKKEGLFKKRKFSRTSNPKAALLNKVIKKGKGVCIGLSILYKVLADELELPIYCVDVPEHIFVRWDDGDVKRNIETMRKGEEYDDSFYRKYYKCDDEYYLKNLNKKETVGAFLQHRGGLHGRREMTGKGLEDINKALELSPKNPALHYSKALAELAKIFEPEGDWKKTIKRMRGTR